MYETRVRLEILLAPFLVPLVFWTRVFPCYFSVKTRVNSYRKRKKGLPCLSIKPQIFWLASMHLSTMLVYSCFTLGIKASLVFLYWWHEFRQEWTADNLITLHVNYGCNLGIFQMYSFVFFCEKIQGFHSDKKIFCRDISLFSSYIFLYRLWRIQSFHWDYTCQSVMMWDYCFLR